MAACIDINTTPFMLNGISHLNSFAKFTTASKLNKILSDMANFIHFTVALMWLSLFLCIATALPTSEDERYFDKELNRELINWLSSVHYAQALNNPCRYYSGNSLNAPMPKRNSELINSLLSLPKNMNDAGK